MITPSRHTLQFIDTMQEVTKSFQSRQHLYLCSSSKGFEISDRKSNSCSFRLIFNEALKIVRSENVSLDHLASLKDSLSVFVKKLTPKEPSGWYAFPGVSLLYNFAKNKLLANSQTLISEIDEILATKEKYKATKQKSAIDFLPEGTRRLINGVKKGAQMAKTIGRALAIKEIYQDRHYVFTHATTAAFTACFCLMKSLIKEKTGFKTRGPYTFLRLPSTQKNTATQFLKSHPELIDKRRIDHDYSKELLSVDGYFWSDAGLGESALDFLQTNRTATIDASSVITYQGKTFFVHRIPNQVLQDIFTYFQVPLESRNELKQAIDQIVADYQVEQLKEAQVKADDFEEKRNIASKALIGDFYLICIEKAYVQNPKTNPVYASKFSGRPVESSAVGKTMVQELERLQKGQIKIEATEQSQKLSDYQRVPQYRIVTSALDPIHVRSIGIKAASKALYAKMKGEIREVAKRAIDSRSHLPSVPSQLSRVVDPSRGLFPGTSVVADTSMPK